MAKKNRRKPLAEYDESELRALLDKQGEYEALPDSELDQFVNLAIGVYGMTRCMELVPQLFALYTLRGQDWHIFKALELMNE
jgi:hypothetical protein